MASGGARSAQPRVPPPQFSLDQLPPKVRLPLDIKSIEDSFHVVPPRSGEPPQRVLEVIQPMLCRTGASYNDMRSVEHAILSLRDLEYLSLLYYQPLEEAVMKQQGLRLLFHGTTLELASQAVEHGLQGSHIHEKSTGYKEAIRKGGVGITRNERKWVGGRIPRLTYLTSRDKIEEGLIQDFYQEAHPQGYQMAPYVEGYGSFSARLRVLVRVDECLADLKDGGRQANTQQMYLPATLTIVGVDICRQTTSEAGAEWLRLQFASSATRKRHYSHLRRASAVTGLFYPDQCRAQFGHRDQKDSHTPVPNEEILAGIVVTPPQKASKKDKYKSAGRSASSSVGEGAATAEGTVSAPFPPVAVQDVPFHYRQPWFEKREDYWYCCLCHAYATEAHLQTSKHTWRAAHPADYFDGNQKASSSSHTQTGTGAQVAASAVLDREVKVKCGLCHVELMVYGLQITTTCMSCRRVVCMQCRQPDRPIRNPLCKECNEPQEADFIPDWDEDGASIESVCDADQ